MVIFLNSALHCKGMGQKKRKNVVEVKYTFLLLLEQICSPYQDDKDELEALSNTPPIKKKETKEKAGKKKKVEEKEKKKEKDVADPTWDLNKGNLLFFLTCFILSSDWTTCLFIWGGVFRFFKKSPLFILLILTLQIFS